MVFASVVGALTNRRRKEHLTNNKREKFSNNDSNNNRLQQIVYVIDSICCIVAMVMFFKCKNLKGDFDFLEFLAALCYSTFYVIYRIIVPPNEENCKSSLDREIERRQKISQALA